MDGRIGRARGIMAAMSGPPITDDVLLSTPDIARAYDVDPRTVVRWINERGLRGFKVGGRWRVPRGAMDDFLVHGRFSPPAE